MGDPTFQVLETFLILYQGGENTRHHILFQYLEQECQPHETWLCAGRDSWQIFIISTSVQEVQLWRLQEWMMKSSSTHWMRGISSSFLSWSLIINTSGGLTHRGKKIYLREMFGLFIHKKTLVNK